MRPSSIISFDRLYLVSIGLGLVQSLMTLDRTRVAFAANPAIARLGSPDTMVYVAIAVSVAIPLLIWHLIAHRANVLAKWVLVGFTALALVYLGLNFRVLGAVAGAGFLLTLAVAAMRVVAISFLFRDDAKAWFAAPSATHAAD